MVFLDIIDAMETSDVVKELEFWDSYIGVYLFKINIRDCKSSLYLEAYE